MLNQIYFHIMFLLNRPAIKALAILTAIMLLGMLYASGMMDSRLVTDADRTTSSLRYTTESLQLIKSVGGVTGMLTAALCYLRPNSRYVVYLIENPKTKRETGYAKILAVWLSMSAVYVLAISSYTGIGCLFTTYFDVTDSIWIKVGDAYRFIIWLTLFQSLITQLIPSLFSVGVGMGVMWLLFSIPIADYQPLVQEILCFLLPISIPTSSSDFTMISVARIAIVMITLALGNVVSFVYKDAF